MIGIVSHADDVHAQAVIQHLGALEAPYVLLDTAAVPGRATLTTTQSGDAVGGGAWTGRWTAEAADVDLTAVHAVWWRRPLPFVLDDAMTDPHDRAFARGECAAMVAGLWACMDAEWVNDPVLDEAANRKMWQLQVASSLGLRVPRTCMTNDPDRARAFIATEPGPVVYKSFSATEVTWRETRVVRDDDLAMLDQVRLAPVIFQEAVPGGVDVRVTIVGDAVFPAELRPRASGYEYDFRVDSSPLTTETTLPGPVEKRLRLLMDRLGLRYGAVDLRLAPDGELVFLEVNPAGQWLFVEMATGQPISRALASLLHQLDRGRGG